MRVGTLIRRTHGEPEHIGLVGIAIEEYRMDSKTYFVVLFSNGQTGRGWTYDSWGMEVLCE